ncbi:hypothetical protein PsYK624_133220 [Phanerochaete sordida]|uniref:Uncharacterized protein n=1 Tax=Phanerochaete sordida TaxID=48140 RepID=A0A9P3GLT2_9APHY|nr:hypothetical protein PsYK624_133220 [Phanerochaete sordida]
MYTSRERANGTRFQLDHLLHRKAHGKLFRVDRHHYIDRTDHVDEVATLDLVVVTRIERAVVALRSSANPVSDAPHMVDPSGFAFRVVAIKARSCAHTSNVIRGKGAYLCEHTALHVQPSSRKTSAFI